MLPCREARASGQWDRWVQVQLTYCRGAERALQLMASPSFSLQYGGAQPEIILDKLKDIMVNFKVRLFTFHQQEGMASASPGYSCLMRSGPCTLCASQPSAHFGSLCIHINVGYVAITQ